MERPLQERVREGRPRGLPAALEVYHEGLATTERLLEHDPTSDTWARELEAVESLLARLGQMADASNE